MISQHCFSSTKTINTIELSDVTELFIVLLADKHQNIMRHRLPVNKQLLFIEYNWTLWHHSLIWHPSENKHQNLLRRIRLLVVMGYYGPRGYCVLHPHCGGSTLLHSISQGTTSIQSIQLELFNIQLKSWTNSQPLSTKLHLFNLHQSYFNSLNFKCIWTAWASRMWPLSVKKVIVAFMHNLSTLKIVVIEFNWLLFALHSKRDFYLNIFIGKFTN